MKKKKSVRQTKTLVPKRGIINGKHLYILFIIIVMIAAMAIQARASENVWTKAKTIMQDVYTQILTISTIAAVVTAAVALLMMNFSKNGKTVDESRAWLKRIIITWAVLNALGFIMAYITPFFAGGQWTDTTPTT